ncbi:MAG: acyl-CoA mutase large subunit family protein [Selenomonadaceae bacterium]|nr:acyl-CoA mutase large subunit family protein [Selenomonadaceae bacterium]
MSDVKNDSAELDLQAIIKAAESQTNFPDVDLSEFTPPTYEEWKQACIDLLKGAPFEKKMYTKTYEGITFEPMYFRATTEDILPKNSFPGMDNYLRGARVNGYVNQPWGVAQSCDETMPDENNALLRHEIDKGSTIYNVKLDTATLNATCAREADKVGDIGVSLSCLDDVETLLKGLKLDQYPLYVYAGQSAAPLLSMIVAALKKNGGDLKKLKGFIGADPIGELVANGKLNQPLDKLYDEAAAIGKWAVYNAPELKTFLVKSDAYVNGGANDVQEIAYALSTAVAYMRAMLERGATPDQAAELIMFQFSMGENFFMQIAKLRAVRPIWAEIVKAFGGSEEVRHMHIHARPSYFFKTVYDPYVNMLRNTTEIFSGVVGGVDSFESTPFDEAVRKGDEFSRRIARNVQIILQEEFGMLQPIDPAGGSWAVETLTKQIKEKIWAEFQAIESKGGMVAALKEGYPQEAIAKVLTDRLKAADSRRDRIVGTNMYANMLEERLDARVENFDENKKIRLAAIDKFRASLDEAAVEAALAKVSADDFDTVIAAAAAGAPIRKLREALGNGEGETVTAIKAHRRSEKFEKLRAATEAFKASKGDNVKIFLANMGPIPQHKARADFTTGFLQVGGFDVLTNNGFATVDEAAAAAKDSGADAVVICSTDPTYPEIVPALAPKLHEVLPKATVYLAGTAPAELVETYKAAGIDDYINVRANCFKVLTDLQTKKGVIA